MVKLSLAHRKRKPSKHQEVQATSSDSEATTSDGSATDEQIRKRMLDALAQRSLARFTLDEPSSSHCSPTRKQCDLDAEEEWPGIRDCDADLKSEKDADNQDESEGGDELDDGEDLLETSRRMLNPEDQTNVIVFEDPSRSARPTVDMTCINSERKAFMASLLKKQHARIDKSLGKPKFSSKEDAEEAHLQSLDRSLVNLITTLSAPKSNADGLEAILAADLPPLANSSNPQRHPRRIKQGMAQASLKRSQAADREAAMGGVVRAHGSKTATKRQKRMHDGTEDRERRERRARVDKGPGTTRSGMIKLTSKEISMVEKGCSVVSSGGKKTGSKIRR